MASGLGSEGSRITYSPFCLVETAGYYFRSQSHDDVRKTLPFIIQNLLVLAAPPFLAASIFMSPRRIARVLDSEHFVIWPRLASKLFVPVDVGCLGTQVTGAIMSGSEDIDEARKGQKIIVVGLVIQLISLCFFILWTGSLHWRLRSASFDGWQLSRLRWQRPMYALYAIATLFIVRSATRIVEYQQGSDDKMLSTEAILYALDAAVMLAIVIIFLILHPGRLRFKARRFLNKGLTESRIQLERISSDNYRHRQV